MSGLKLEYRGYVYNPLDYAWDMHEKFLRKAVTENQKVLLLGMNPGPFGMCQNGVPFGDKVNVREYLKIDGKIGKPERDCPKRPIEGLDVKRVEMSGKRIWGTISELWSPEEFFSFATVFNYCPLCFLDEGGRNVTPDKLSLSEFRQQCCGSVLCSMSRFQAAEILKIIQRFLWQVKSRAGRNLILKRIRHLSRTARPMRQSLRLSACCAMD